MVNDFRIFSSVRLCLHGFKRVTAGRKDLPPILREQAQQQSLAAWTPIGGQLSW